MKICPTCKTEYAGGEVFCPVDATRLETPSQLQGKDERPRQDPLVGTVLAGRYKVVRRIGEGGMGLVYEGFHTVIEKRVAIKVLRDDFSSRPDVVERFRQEAKSASRIGHEHIVDISDFGETPSGASYFVMEFLEGEDLANVLAREHALDPQRAIAILVQCTRALGAAHAKGIVHRDMKPENIFLVRRDDNPAFVKLVDFGIAKMSDIETDGAPGRKLTKTGMIFGTPEYMSPEQAAGKPLDHRVDVYACGVILFELLTGRVPFVGDSFMGILTQHMFENPPKLREVHPQVRCSAELEAVLYKALAKNADERFQNMEELTEALLAAAQGRMHEATLLGFGEPVKATAKAARAGAPTRADTELPIGDGPSKGGSRWAVIAAGAVLFLGAGAAATYAVLAKQAERHAVSSPVPEPVTTGVDAPPPRADDTSAALAVAADAPPVPPSRVAVTVDTRPSGGSILVEGTDTRCAPAPCAVEVEPGHGYTLHAESGRLVGSLAITPETPMTVLIPLSPRPVGRAPSDSSSMSTSMQHSGDLKIPDIFR